MSRETNRKGTWGEMLGAAWLLEQGYEVFRNLSPNGPADLIAIKGDVFLRIEVRVCGITYSKWKGKPYPLINARELTAEQKGLGIIRLFVSPKGKCSFDIADHAMEMLGRPTGEWPNRRGLAKNRYRRTIIASPSDDDSGNED